VCGGLSNAIIVAQAAALWKYIANCLTFHNNRFFVSIGWFSKLAFFCNQNRLFCNQNRLSSFGDSPRTTGAMQANRADMIARVLSKY